MKSGSSNKKLIGLGLVGALVTGFLASACCLGPLLLALLGVGSAGFLGIFAPYRPFFLAFTLLFLGLAFYLAYRRPREAAACPDGGCTAPGGRKIQKVILWLAAGMAIVFLFFPDILMRLR